MIVFLLCVIIAILLFGSSAVLGVARAILIGAALLLAALVLGWQGIAWVFGIGALVFGGVYLKAEADARSEDRHTGWDYYPPDPPKPPSGPPAHVVEAMRRQRELNEEFEARKRGGTGNK